MALNADVDNRLARLGQRLHVSGVHEPHVVGHSVHPQPVDGVAALERLARVNAFCLDKTGTLTENRMSLIAFRPDDTATRAALIERGAQASPVDAFDPMDRAFHIAGAATSQAGNGPAPSLPASPAKVYALSPDLFAVTQVWTDGSVAAKGAPEAIADLCRLSDRERQGILEDAAAMARQGMRVLGIAEARNDGPGFPETPRAFAFRFLGLVGLADPLRAEVPRAIAECATAGVRVVMITGDHPQTAQAIARQAGLPEHEPVTGSGLAALFLLHEGSEVGDGFFHHAGRLHHLRQKHFTRAEQIADDAHAVHERPFDDEQWLAQLLARLFGVVLDEVDVMLNMGFREDIEVILQDAPVERQTVFFSATIPRPIQQLIEKYHALTKVSGEPI